VEPAAKWAPRVEVEYELEYASPEKETSRVQLKLSGKCNQTLTAALDGLDGCKIEVETKFYPGATEPYHVTGVKLTGQGSTDNESVQFCPKLRSVAGQKARLEIGPQKFSVLARSIN